MEVESPITQQPTNLANDDYKSEHPQDPQFSNVRKSINAQPVPPIPGVPIGLEPLVPVNHISVKRQQETFGVTLNAHQYDVFDGLGQRIFHALETTDLSTKRLVISRNFTVDMMDPFGQKILTMKRELKGFTGDVLLISLGDGTSLGEFNHLVSCGCVERFNIKNTDGERILFMRGPEEGCCRCDTTLLIFTMQGEQIGVIHKAKSGFLQEFGKFGVEFPRQLDVTTKALILAAVFLLDFLNAEAQTAAAI